MTVPSASDAVAIRASDREREQHIGVLRRHAGDGRLTFEELEQRIESAYAARTQEELAAVLAGLPALADPDVQPRPLAAKRHGLDVAELAPYVGVNVLLIAIWALSGAAYFWPIWPILGWGVCILSHAPQSRLGRPPLPPARCDTTRSAGQPAS